MGGSLTAVTLHKHFDASVQEATICGIAGFFFCIIFYALTDKAS